MEFDPILGMNLIEAQEYLSRIKCKIEKVEKTRPPFSFNIGDNPTERVVGFFETNAGGIELLVADFRA